MIVDGRARLLGLAGPVTVVRAFHATPLERKHALTPPQASSVIRALCREAGIDRDGHGLSDVRELLAFSATARNWAGGAQALADQVLDAVRRGEVLVADGWQMGDHWTSRRPSTPGARIQEAGPEAALSPPRPTVSDKRGWIEVEIVDEDGRPVRGVTVGLKSPDGRTHEADASADGLIRIDRLVEGDCEVTLSAFNGADWEVG